MMGWDWKWLIARAVYQEVDQATRQPNFAFLPQYDGLDEEELHFLIHITLEFHVESRDGTPILEPGCQYSVSLQPAMYIALAAALHCKDYMVTSDWQTFEPIVMLAELKHMVAHFTDLPNGSERTLMGMRYPFPAVGNDCESFTIPKVTRFTLVRNPLMSSYADVIAPFRLVRAKYSEDVSVPTFLDLAKELNKMGLCTNILSSKVPLRVFTKCGRVSNKSQTMRHSSVVLHRILRRGGLRPTPAPA